MDHKHFYLPWFLHRLWLSRACPFHYHHMYVYAILEDRLSEARRIPRTTCVFQDLSVAEDEDEDEGRGNEATPSVPPSHSSPLPPSPLRFLMSTLTTMSSSLLFLPSQVSSCFSPPSSSLCPSPLGQQSQDKETSFRMSLQSARTAIRSLEQNVEKILVRILPLAAVVTKASPTENDLCSLTLAGATSSSVVTTTATATCITMSGEDLDMLRRYFVFLHFRNSSVYTEMMNKMSYVHRGLESEQEQQRAQHNRRQADELTLSVRGQRQAFLDEVAYFLALQPHEKTLVRNADLKSHCWQLCDAQVSFGFAPAQVEYLHSERLFGSLDDTKDGHEAGDDGAVGRRHLPSFLFPVSPTMALYIVGGLANAPGTVPGQFFVDCTRETAGEVCLRNAAMLLQNGSGDRGHSQRVYFSSLRATLNSLASIGGQRPIDKRSRRDDENCWYGRFRERCLERQALEATSRKLVLVDDNDNDGHGKDNRSGNNRQQRIEPRQGREQESNGPSCVVVDDLTEQMALQLKKGPCAFGSLADVYKGELTLPLEGPDKMRLTVAVKCMRRHVIKDHMKWLRDEVAAWHAQQHPHVARLFGLVRLDDGSGNDSDDVWFGMVSSWCENGTIVQYLVKNPLADRLRLLIEVASGCSYLHNYSPVVIHGDLRGSNILIDADGRAIITDFGLSRVTQESFCSGTHISDDNQQNERQQHILISTSFSSQFTVAARWLAPELIRAGACSGHALPITTESDVYSFGCFCLEVATGDMPFPHLNNNCAVILDVLLHGAKPSMAVGGAHLGHGIAPRARPGFWKLLDQCWSAQPEMRPPMADVLHSLYHLRDTCS